MLLNDSWFEGPVTISRHLDRHGAKALERLRRLAVARVAAFVRGRVVLLFTDALGQFRSHGALQQLLRLIASAARSRQ